MQLEQAIASIPAEPSESLSLKARRTELPTATLQPPPTARTAALRSVPAHTASQPIWAPEPRQSTEPTSSEVIQASQRPTTSLSAAAEARLMELITGPSAAGVSHQQAGAIREQQVCAFLEELTVLDAHHLDRRLRCDAESDPIAVAFRRLVPERRQRIRAHLDAVKRALATCSQAARRAQAR